MASSQTSTPLSSEELADRLRPRTIAEILDGAFGLYRNTFGRVVAGQAIMLAPLAPLTLLSPLVSQLLLPLFYTLTQALCYREGMDTLLARRIGLGASLGRAVRDWPVLLFAALLYFVGVVVVAFAAAIPALGVALIAGLATLAPVAAVAAVGAAGMAGVATVAGATYLGLYAPIALFESRWMPLRRSIELVRGAFWKVILTIILVGILVGIPQGVLQLAIWLEDGMRSNLFKIPPQAWHLIGSSAIAVLTVPLSVYVTILLWVDRCATRDGTDLAPRPADDAIARIEPI